MAVELNHIIVPARDKQASADFLAGILGVAEVNAWGPFVQLHLSNGVALDYYEMDTDFSTQHCAFMVSEEEFDASFERIKQAGIAYWADPFKNQPNEINNLYGGRGVYFDDPSGHSMEIITKPYGAEPPYRDVSN